MDFIKGKKTYIGIAAGVVYSVLINLNYVPNNEIVWTLIMGWTGVGFRDALNKR